MSRRVFALLILTALFSVAAEEGSKPWRGQRVYGWGIMTKEERGEFRAEMRTYRTYEEQLAFWRRHIKAMQQRAWDRGLSIEPATEIMPASELARIRRPVFAIGLMAGSEVEAYRAAEAAIVDREHTPEEYEAFLAEHEARMRKRAWDRGWAIDPEDEARERSRKKKQRAKEAAYHDAVVKALAEKALADEALAEQAEAE